MPDAVPTTRAELLERIERMAPQQRWIGADRRELGPLLSLCDLIDVPLATIHSLLGQSDWLRAEAKQQPNQWLFRISQADGLRFDCLGRFQHVVWIYIDHTGAAPTTLPGHMINGSNPLRRGLDAMKEEERDAFRADVTADVLRYGKTPPSGDWPARVASMPLAQAQPGRRSTRGSTGAPRRASTVGVHEARPRPARPRRKRSVPPHESPLHKRIRDDDDDVTAALAPAPAPVEDDERGGEKRDLSVPSTPVREKRARPAFREMESQTEVSRAKTLVDENIRLRDQNARLFESVRKMAESNTLHEAANLCADRLIADVTARYASARLEVDAALPSNLEDAASVLGRRIAGSKGSAARSAAYRAVYVESTARNRKNGMLFRVGNSNLGSDAEDLSDLSRLVTSISTREMNELKRAMGERYRRLKEKNGGVGVGAFVMKRGELEPLDLKADLAMKKKYAPQLCTILEAATASASYLSEQRAAEKNLKQGKPHRDRRRTKGNVELWRSGRELKAYVSRRSGEEGRRRGLPVGPHRQPTHQRHAPDPYAAPPLLDGRAREPRPEPLVAGPRLALWYCCILPYDVPVSAPHVRGVCGDVPGTLERDARGVAGDLGPAGGRADAAAVETRARARSVPEDGRGPGLCGVEVDAGSAGARDRRAGPRARALRVGAGALGASRGRAAGDAVGYRHHHQARQLRLEYEQVGAPHQSIEEFEGRQHGDGYDLRAVRE